ncbi:phospholipase D1/2 [Azospirillum lipoferum]|uniref:Phospholipase D n=1 Tax=Azospirillum lipoferum TaxID=193 RepID=A0A5A9GPV8_AZOLI|nr:MULTISPECIES: phospholipase D-like domain-containing protein [Azospirillum]KAA0595855.1 phospholipase [Azospirillum lipoferum]MCP1611259.1 phospholipase D1/2 [Azospirillum lipoferum]MDW5537063.1 phospholipase D-like domain-containing protein [Azospirillum sp. NL1]
MAATPGTVRAESVSQPGPVLVPGRTCWRLEKADRMAVIIDAAAYFARIKAAILHARHTVMLIGWDFDTRIKLEPDDPMPDVPNELGDFLSWIVRVRPDLTINVLKWDLSVLKMPFRGRTPLVLLDWMSSRRLRFRLDSAHPPGACHHQKIAIIDDALAFCGGIDMTTDRWDTPDHRDDDPRRVRPSGEPYGPFHDVTTAVDGDAARALGELARERWRRATGEQLVPPPPVEPYWPEDLEPDFRDIPVAIARTDPLSDDWAADDEGRDKTGKRGVREIEALYLAAIAAARRFIYLESQYFASQRIVGAIAARLSEPDGPEVVVVNPERTPGWVEEEAMGSARSLLVQRLREHDPQGRFRILAPVTAGGQGIYVHAKVLVVDDRLLRVGSSNINNRSQGLDSECDLAIECPDGECPDGGRPEVCRAIRSVRTRLMAEHLGVAVEEVERTEEATGSLTATVDRLMRPAGRSLRPLEPEPLSETERRLVDERLLDPDRPEPMAETILRGATLFGDVNRTAWRIGAGVMAGAAVGVGLAVLARRNRLGKNFRGE